MILYELLHSLKDSKAVKAQRSEKEKEGEIGLGCKNGDFYFWENSLILKLLQVCYDPCKYLPGHGDGDTTVIAALQCRFVWPSKGYGDLTVWASIQLKTTFLPIMTHFQFLDSNPYVVGQQKKEFRVWGNFVAPCRMPAQSPRCVKKSHLVTRVRSLRCCRSHHGRATPFKGECWSPDGSQPINLGNH